MTLVRSSSTERWTSAVAAPRENCLRNTGHSKRRQVIFGPIGGTVMPIQPYQLHEPTLQPNCASEFPPTRLRFDALPRSVAVGRFGRFSGARWAEAWRSSLHFQRIFRCFRNPCRYKYPICGRVTPYAEFRESLSGIDGSGRFMLVALRRQSSAARTRCCRTVFHRNRVQASAASGPLGRRRNPLSTQHAMKLSRGAVTRRLVRKCKTSFAVPPNSFVQAELFQVPQSVGVPLAVTGDTA